MSYIVHGISISRPAGQSALSLEQGMMPLAQPTAQWDRRGMAMLWKAEGKWRGCCEQWVQQEHEAIGNTAGWKDCLKTSGYKWEQNQVSLFCWSQNDSYKAEWITLICTEILCLFGNSSYCACAITISAVPDWSDPCKNQKTDKTA